MSKEKIVAGLYHSIARRVSAMIGSFGSFSEIIFTGGVARNRDMQRTLARVLGAEVVVPKEPQMVGALGAALVVGKFREPGVTRMPVGVNDYLDRRSLL